MEGKIMKTVFNYTTHKSNEDYVAFRASKHDTIGTHIVLTVSKLNDHPWIKDARKAKPEIKLEARAPAPAANAKKKSALVAPAQLRRGRLGC